MSDSIFDPTQFLDATTSEASTRRDPLPAGEYLGTLGEPKFRQNQGRKDPSVTYTWIDIPVLVDLTSLPDLHSALGVDSVSLRYSGSVDTLASGGIDYGKGKSQGLRQAREATGLNQPGQPFSPRQLQGRVVRVRVKHEVYEGNLMERVDALTKA